MNEMEVDFCERLGDVEARASVEVPLSGCSAHIVVRDMSYLEEDPEDESGGDALSLKDALTAYLEGNAGYEDRDLRAEVEGSFAALKKSLAFLGVTGRLIPMPPLSATSTEDALFEAAVRDFEDALTEQDLLIT
jgi:hypothetical protein